MITVPFLMNTSHWELTINKCPYSLLISAPILNVTFKKLTQNRLIRWMIKRSSYHLSIILNISIYDTREQCCQKCWLVNSEVIGKALWFTPSSQRETKWFIVRNKVFFWSTCYSVHVVCTKSITCIHFSVGQSGGHLPPLWWIIVNKNYQSPCWSLL